MCRPCFYTDSCVYDTVAGFQVRLGLVYLKSVISESLKRLGQFREDKWWIGRTADVGTQTLQDDGVDWGPAHCGGFFFHGSALHIPTTTTAAHGWNHPLCPEVSSEQPVHMSHSITLIKTNDKEWLLGFHNVFCIIKLVNCIAQNKWAE